jgi:nucleotide-binding universal stress UspA family protein
VVPPEGERAYPPASVLVGTDGSDGSAAAVDRALDTGAATGATVHAVSVLESSVLGFDVGDSAVAAERERRETDLLAPVRERGDARGVDVETAVREGDVVDELTAYADEHGVGMVVVGTHGRTGLDKRLLGSVTENLLRSATIPVLSVRTSQA